MASVMVAPHLNEVRERNPPNRLHFRRARQILWAHGSQQGNILAACSGKFIERRHDGQIVLPTLDGQAPPINVRQMWLQLTQDAVQTPRVACDFDVAQVVDMLCD